MSRPVRSDQGRDCHGAFLGLMMTCAKLEIPFWDYLGDRLKAPDAPAAPTWSDKKAVPA